MTKLPGLSAFHPDQTEPIDELRESLKERRCTLVLGSGVSHTVGIPMWRPLVSMMKRHAALAERDPGKRSLINALQSTMDDPLLLIRQLEQILGFKSKVIGLLRECLYADYDASKEAILLEPLCRWLLSDGPRSTQHVITYNFDNTLERCLGRLGRLVHVVHSAETFSDTRRMLRVYHPHGYLPHPSDDRDDLHVQDAVVFSERDYHRQYMQPNSWLGTAQLHHFMSRTCLMIGLSLTDPNQRRLLDHAHMQLTGVRLPRHFAVQKQGSSRARDHLSSMQLESLGVRVIWVKEYSELSDLLKQCCS